MEKIIKVNPATLFLTWKFGVKAPKWFCSLHIRAWRCSLKNHTDCRKNSVRFLYCTYRIRRRAPCSVQNRYVHRSVHRTELPATLISVPHACRHRSLFSSAPYIFLLGPTYSQGNAGTQGRWTLGIWGMGGLSSLVLEPEENIEVLPYRIFLMLCMVLVPSTDDWL